MTAARVEIRRATGSDAAAVADVYLRSRAAAGSAFPPGVHPDDDVRRHVREHVVPERETWVAVDADDPGRMLGVLAIDAPAADLDWLFVAPEAQGRGVGSALLDHAVERHPGGLALWVFASNVPARDFYERRGWREVRRTDGDNEEGAPDIRYARGAHPESEAGPVVDPNDDRPRSFTTRGSDPEGLTSTGDPGGQLPTVP